MKTILGVFVVLAMTSGAHAADANHPVVVELFQSQGCSSCPPANANVLAVADRPDVLALSWQVTYWDYLGWKDTLGADIFTKRQYDYARTLKHDGVFTPQVVVNGRVDGVGAERGEVAGLMTRGDRGSGGPDVTMQNNQVTIGAGQGAAKVLLVRYDPAVVRVAVRRGENAGETLTHRNVVREVRVLGAWRGSAERFDVLPREGLRMAILVQAEESGAILAAGRD